MSATRPSRDMDQAERGVQGFPSESKSSLACLARGAGQRCRRCSCESWEEYGTSPLVRGSPGSTPPAARTHCGPGVCSCARRPRTQGPGNTARVLGAGGLCREHRPASQGPENGGVQAVAPRRPVLKASSPDLSQAQPSRPVPAGHPHGAAGMWVESLPPWAPSPTVLLLEGLPPLRSRARRSVLGSGGTGRRPPSLQSGRFERRMRAAGPSADRVRRRAWQPLLRPPPPRRVWQDVPICPPRSGGPAV